MTAASPNRTRDATPGPLPDGVRQLVSQGFCDTQQLQWAFNAARSEGKNLTTAIEGASGRALPADVAEPLRRLQKLEQQLLCGCRLVDVDQEAGKPDELLHLCGHVLALEECRRLLCLPLRADIPSRRVVVLIAAGCPERQRQDIGQLVRRLGFDAEFHYAFPSELSHFLGKLQLYQQATDVTDIADDGSLEESEPDNPEGPELEAAMQESSTTPVVTLANKILVRSLSLGASDIHVEPQEKELVVRLRRDGVLQKTYSGLSRRLIPPLTSRFKIMADLDIAERRLPQDGRIRRRFRGRTIDLRVSSLPSRYGEKICLRLLDNSTTRLGLDVLITNPLVRTAVREMGSHPYGMILVTGPTGSGKSTSLYGLLAEINTPEINISTVEDPIEYTLPGITQTQVNREKGFDFATALRAFMRQDPDVLLVGETRDLETAKTAVEAALTGHLVLTTLHCNDAASAVVRLEEMGVEPFKVSSALIGVVSQRLLRRVCSACSEACQPSPESLARVGLRVGANSGLVIYRAHRSKPGELDCSQCGGTGYKGRIGVYEVLRMNEELAAAIARGTTTDRIRKMATASGMKTLLGYGLDLVREGYTTLAEVERVLLTDAGLASERRARTLSSLTCQGCGAVLQDTWLECPYCLCVRPA